jgi:hypothetical protein
LSREGLVINLEGMDADRTSYELLSHFERPKIAVLDDFEWVEDVDSAASDDAPGAPDAGCVQVPALRPSRGVRWVIHWTAALVTLAISANVLVEFGYLLAAENSLNLAARAGALEATLPRATYQSITAAVERRLADFPQLRGKLEVSLLQNGKAVGQQFRASDGDRLSITISTAPSSFVPGWLRTLSFWRDEAPIIVRAEREVPGRKLNRVSSKAP